MHIIVTAVTDFESRNETVILNEWHYNIWGITNRYEQDKMDEHCTAIWAASTQ